jgi:acyl-coenzyme A synthetase/AMP-(fatty) acid ligase
VPRGLLLAKALGVPGRRIVAGPVTPLTRRLLGAAAGLAELARAGRGLDVPPDPPPAAECAVVFTSGATGPAKGVVYRHHQVRAQLEILRDAFQLTGEDRLVAAFPPFALYGPALGIASVVPDVDAPGRLTATALARAVDAAQATVVFASPAALRAVVATADALGTGDRATLDRVRLAVSAGAPVPAQLLHELRAVLPAAELHAPYGMTEALPVTDVTLAEIDAAGPGNGVCVGRPLPGIEVRLSPLADDGTAPGPLTTAPLVTGEICVRGPHLKDRYDQLWATEHDSSRNPGWHRTGDVGHLDQQGRLWVEGRLGHVVAHLSGPVTPVGIEQRVQRLDPARTAAAVGVGPRGTQQVVVVETGGRGRTPLAPAPLAAQVRAAAGVEVAAVLLTDALPVDIRHASKIDRARVAGWAERVLAGRRTGRRP